jgi:alkylhydroperoxidase family enzyme
MGYQCTVTTDPRAVHAPAAYGFLAELEAATRAGDAAEALAVARRRVAMALGPAAWEAPGDDAVGTFTDQFVIDVTGVDIGPLADQLGPAVGPFVQGLWVLDLGARTDLALGELFGAPCPPRPVVGPGDGQTFDAFLRAVAQLRNLDPITSEVVRLRGARFHNCRMCKSLRTASALREGADETLFDKIDRYDSSDLAEPYKVALRLTDAIITQPGAMSAELVDHAHVHFSDAQLVELTLDVMRNAANKIAVAFGADAANVTDGFELYDVLPDGNVVYGLTSLDA